jgi:hypothetical protein
MLLLVGRLQYPINKHLTLTNGRLDTSMPSVPDQWLTFWYLCEKGRRSPGQLRPPWNDDIHEWLRSERRGVCRGVRIRVFRLRQIRATASYPRIWAMTKSPTGTVIMTTGDMEFRVYQFQILWSKRFMPSRVLRLEIRALGRKNTGLPSLSTTALDAFSVQSHMRSCK